MNASPQLSIVIAVQHAEDNLPVIMERLSPLRRADVEFLVCHTEADPNTSTLVPKAANVRTLCGDRGSLIPHLWRDGIVVARGMYVATLTAHCIPTSNWLTCLQQLDFSQVAGLGGTVDNDRHASPAAWAIFFLRYIAYAPPQATRRVLEIAADNAVYRRADLIAHPDLLERGFWEPSFHARLQQNGQDLCLTAALRVVHHNRYTVRHFLRQRFHHGTQFGLTRGSSFDPLRRMAYILLSPFLPGLFMIKVLRRTLRHEQTRRHLPAAFPWLLLYVIAWGAGEGWGYLQSLHRTRRVPT